MNVHGKRPRLHSSHQRDFPPPFAAQHEYYDELGMDQEEEEVEEELPYDPHTELHQRRAELDHRLKNTFEDIFAKYERDFDGIGDEIDLETGEIVVNNGHLIDMMDERDAGLRKARRDLVEDSESLESSEVEDESLEDESLEDGEEEIEDDQDEVEDEEDEDEEEEEEEDGTTGESMDDDDLILRGFTQANRFLQASPELGMPMEKYSRPPVSRPEPKTQHRRSLKDDALASHSDILAQFGPQLGPQIVGYITAQEKARESHIEPAWRVPDIPSAAPKKRPVQAHYVRPREVARSLSPEASASVWAISKGPRKQKIPSGMALPGSAQSKRVRNTFTVEEDEAMLEYVAKARRNGTPLFAAILWKGLAAKYPRHSWAAWQGRYKRNFYLSTNSDQSENETTAKDVALPSKKSHVAPPMQYISDRPNRERKPAQRDSRIISWSQAVDTIAAVDPDLHAGILDDARRARNGEVSWDFGRPEVPMQSKPSPYGSTPRRPVSASEMDELQRDFGRSQREPAKDFGGSRLPLSGAPGGQVQHKKTITSARAPCPHANCKHLTVHQYRLGRLNHEDMSEMALHLLRDHHTTSFPCEESDCLQTGERGYFIQEDLVKHVKAAHPNAAALGRLRGRVDSVLLGGEERVCIDLTEESPDSNKSAIRHKKSDFMRNSNTHSNSDVFSSSPDHNRTLTPATFGERAGGASVLTPLTSFSSLAVNRSSATAQVREIRDSQEPEMPSGKDIPLPSNSITGNDSLIPGFPSSRMNSFGSNTALRSWSKGPTSEPNQSFGFSTDRFLPETIETNARPQASHQLYHKNSPSPSPYLDPQPDTHHQKIASMQTFPVGAISMAIDTLPTSETILHASPKPSFQPSNDHDLTNSPMAKKTSATKQFRKSETFTRNVVHPSHEFSDEEGPMSPPQVYHLSTPAKVTESFVKPALPQLVTPTVKRKAPKSAIQRVLHNDDDLDELSLVPDDFKIIASHTKPLPPLPAFGTYMGIKREATAGPSLPSATTSRKRKFSDVAPDEIDELGADECFGKSTSKRIKKEVDLNGTPMVHRIKAQRKKAKKFHRDESRRSTMAHPLPLGSAMTNRQMGRSRTPLLDLTPDRRPTDAFGDSREISDSDDSIPSSSLRREFLSAGSKPPDGLLTPTRSKQGSLDPLKLGKTAVVVKTPGGTLRKCGAREFRCGRVFCFRCGYDGAAAMQ